MSSVVVFGFDENVLPYEEAFRRSGKKFVFEGPGQDPFIVFADADLELALSDLMTAKFVYSGQTCTAPKRIFIQSSIYDEFIDRFAERVRRLRVGDPAAEGTDISPVASDLAVERIVRQLAEAKERGAKVVVGGEVHGNLVYPTVVKGATDDMLGMREEVFGPVAYTTPFDSEMEVPGAPGPTSTGCGRRSSAASPPSRRPELVGTQYCHPVERITFGKFGTVALNQPRAESWRGAFVTKAVGGYGYSGWIWETVEGTFRTKQGPKLLSVETSVSEASRGRPVQAIIPRKVIAARSGRRRRPIRRKASPGWPTSSGERRPVPAARCRANAARRGRPDNCPPPCV